ncbi:MAG: hypothetical protein WBP13_02295 [Methylophilaceae bacterium]
MQIKDTLASDITLFEDNLQLMYGEKTLQEAKSLVKAQTQYLGLENLGENMQASQMHQQLLAAYTKVQRVQKMF